MDGAIQSSTYVQWAEGECKAHGYGETYFLLPNITNQVCTRARTHVTQACAHTLLSGYGGTHFLHV